jgi:hypothetical protein
MGTQVFDDGSTLTTDDWGNVVASSDAPYAFRNDVRDAAKISGYVPGDQSMPWWERVFNYSIPRAIDSAIGAKEAASNRGTLFIAGATGRTVPAGVFSGTGAANGQLMWLLLGGILLFALSRK